MIRFIKYLTNKSQRDLKLPVQVMEEAKKSLLRYVQMKHYNKEIINLGKGLVLNKQSSIIKLKPIMI